MYRRRRFYISPRRLREEGYIADDTKVGSREAANSWWDENKTKHAAAIKVLAIDTGRVLTPIKKQLSGSLANNPALVEYWQNAALHEDQEGRLYKDQKLVGISEFQRGYWHAKAEERQAIKQTETIGPQYQQFLDGKLVLVKSDDLSEQNWRNLKALKPHFCEFFGAENHVKVLNYEQVEKYNLQLHELVGQRKIARWTAKNRFAALKQFLRWLDSKELIRLPKNLNRKAFGFDTEAIPITVPIDEIRKLLDHADDEQKLMILLACNLGFTQSPIAALDRTAIVNGRLHHKRHKTRNHKGVPRVAYLLWPQTEYLLESVVLPNRRQMEHAWRKLKIKANSEVRLKDLRSTAASLIFNSQYGRYTQYFLGHSPRTIADGHYATPTQEQFDETLRWLNRQILGE
jgi:integrase